MASPLASPVAMSVSSIFSFSAALALASAFTTAVGSVEQVRRQPVGPAKSQGQRHSAYVQCGVGRLRARAARAIERHGRRVDALCNSHSRYRCGARRTLSHRRKTLPCSSRKGKADMSDGREGNVNASTVTTSSFVSRDRACPIFWIPLRPLCDVFYTGHRHRRGDEGTTQEKTARNRRWENAATPGAGSG